MDYENPSHLTRINLAVGILMDRHQLAVEDAEAMLMTHSAEQGLQPAAAALLICLSAKRQPKPG